MKPELRIIQGDATPEEIAALVAVLATRHADAGPPAVSKTESWRNPARAMRKPLAPGKSAWRLSALP
ncbi:acyl-CoA carboxylase subunit epsilon [Nonomuraea sp. NBC_01738]|uniref:acyl-CoA carboxylase subunit epsilon n=1 Tax=Nonomuraea sp. NBC_01738 TaxID=2976003 RepID=UPI002E0D7E5E|nr:acyl-CoA carboxylase subunit epsilon [Nonomuraea sp. NBC_01738]